MPLHAAMLRVWKIALVGGAVVLAAGWVAGVGTLIADSEARAATGRIARTLAFVVPSGPVDGVHFSEFIFRGWTELGRHGVYQWPVRVAVYDVYTWPMLVDLLPGVELAAPRGSWRWYLTLNGKPWVQWSIIHTASCLAVVCLFGAFGRFSVINRREGSRLNIWRLHWFIAMLAAPVGVACMFVIHARPHRLWYQVFVASGWEAWIDFRVVWLWLNGPVVATSLIYFLALFRIAGLVIRRQAGLAASERKGCRTCGYDVGSLRPCPECGDRDPFHVPPGVYLGRIGAWLSRHRRPAWAVLVVVLIGLYCLPLIIGVAEGLLILVGVL